MAHIQYRVNGRPDPLTPDAEFEYNRMGLKTKVTDAAGTRTFRYNAKLRLETESIAGAGDAPSRLITRRCGDG
jgi:hypothetical protein